MNTSRILVLLLLTASVGREQTFAQNPTAPVVKQDAVAEIGKLQAVYNTAMEVNAAETAKWTEGLEKWYLDGLAKLQEERAKAADLDGALLVKAERERVAAHVETTEEQVKAMPAVMRTLRSAYEGSLKKITEEIAKRNLPVRQKLSADLEALQKRITVSGDLEQAVIVKTEKERFAARFVEIEKERIAAQPKEAKATYLIRPVASYPPESRAAGEHGVVILRIVVDGYGKPTSVTVGRSSGFTRLDRAAVEAGWRSRVKDAVPGAHLDAPVRFNLTDR